MKKSPAGSMATLTRSKAVRYVVNATYSQAVLFFNDGSHLKLEHQDRQNRWAMPSVVPSTADRVCQALHHFRLNAKHLQLFFDDGSSAEFLARQG